MKSILAFRGSCKTALPVKIALLRPFVPLLLSQPAGGPLRRRNRGGIDATRKWPQNLRFFRAKQFCNCLFLLLTTVLFADENTNPPPKPEGWSFDVGGAYTWMTLTTPPTYKGSTGGIEGRVTYQRPWEFFGQVRSIYNLGPLSSSLNKTGLYEWYSEFVGGYCLKICHRWTVTPYTGFGLDFLHSDQTGYGTTAPIKLQYSLYYAVVGLETHYTWEDCMLGLQVDCMPTFNEYLRVKGLSGAAWTLKNRTGAAVKLPVSYRYARNYWIELAPYYRFFPIGSSTVLDLPHRNLQQWGAFVTFRFFL